MTRTLVFTPAAHKDLDALDWSIRRRISAKLQHFIKLSDPLVAASSLAGREFAGLYRWRVGDYRIIFGVEGEQFVVYRIWHRRDVYRL